MKTIVAMGYNFMSLNLRVIDEIHQNMSLKCLISKDIIHLVTTG